MDALSLRAGKRVNSLPVVRAGWRKAQRRAAKLHKKVARQRQDTARKRARRGVGDHDAIAVEDFRPRFLARTTMSRKAADAATAATKTALIEMGRKHSRLVVLVDLKNTTKACAECGARTKHALPLSELRTRDAGPGWAVPGWC